MGGGMQSGSGGRCLPSRSRGFLSLVGLLALLIALPPGVAGASVDKDRAEEAETAAVRFARYLPIPPPPAGPGTGAGHPVAMWASGSRGFLPGDYEPGARLDQPTQPNASRLRHGYNRLTAVDFDSGTVVGHALLDPPLLDQPDFAGRLSPHLVTIDELAGRLFVAHGVFGRREVGRAIAGGSPSFTSPVATACAVELEVAGVSANIPHNACFAGFHVIDAATMEPKRQMVYEPVRVDGAAVIPGLLAVRYVPPPDGGASGGKLLAVVEDKVVNGNAFAEPGRAQFGVVWAVQFDADSGRQEWAVRVDGCRGMRTNVGNEYKDRGERPNPASVMLGERGSERFLWVGCFSGTTNGIVVEVPLDETGMPFTAPATPAEPGAVLERSRTEGAAFRPSIADVVTVAPGQRVFNGPADTVEHWADVTSGRMLLRVVDSTGAEVWWVFDAVRWQLLGTIGIGQFGSLDTAAGFDDATGRLYVLAAGKAFKSGRGGLYLADVRTDPLGQALFFPEFTRYATPTAAGQPHWLTVIAGGAGKPTQIIARQANPQDMFAVLEDRVPVAVSLPAFQFEGRTLNLEEQAGMTSASLDGAARGYGFRAMLIGGAEGASRAGAADPLGQAMTVNQGVNKNPAITGWIGQEDTSPIGNEHACTQGNREVVVGFVGPDGPAVVDGSGSRGGAEPVRLDQMTLADLERPASRCSNVDWDGLWSVGLFGQPPAGEPEVGWLLGTRPVDCVGSEQGTSDTTGDPVLGSFAAKVSCESGEASGFSFARGAAVNGVSVGEALSSFRIYRDPGRGIVSRVESVARGIAIDGVLRIDSVRGTAESWANGRRQRIDAVDRESGYDANCDEERTAGTCFQRHAFGVWTTGYSCGPCGDEATLLDRMNRAMGTQATVRFRDPDPGLAKGAENGFIAAVSKPDSERFADLVLNNDLLQTVVPTLEIVRFTTSNRSAGDLVAGGSTQAPRGRQVYQFAGVEVSSSYGISCLLVYDEETNTCAVEAELPGSLTVSLTDPSEVPLAGGAFEIRKDVDADGVVGLVDTIIPDGACVTAEDGIGTCRFAELQPGSYVVVQTAAPAGYAQHDEPFVVELGPSEERTVTFTNASNLTVVEVTAQDESGRRLAGATFAVLADPDADGKVAADAAPVATCTTDASGVCRMTVPTGSYVLVQLAAPEGLEPIEPVAFMLTSGGQTAAVGVVNHLPSQPDAPQPPASSGPPQVVYEPPVDARPPVESVDVVDGPGVVDEPDVAPGAGLGGTIERVIRAPGDALRLLRRSPLEAVAWTATIALLCLAGLAVARRRQTLALNRHSR